MESKDYSRALLEFQNAARVMPKDAEPYYQSGMAYLEMHSLQSAAAAFRKATQLNPKHADAQLQLAGLMAASRNQTVLQDAERRAREVLAENPDNVRALDTLAAAEFQLGNPANAAALVEQALQKAPADLLPAIMLTRLKLNQGDAAGAEQVLKRAIAANPKSEQAALAMGRFYLTTGKAVQAEQELRRALQLRPNYAPALFSFAIVETRTNRQDEAEQTYKLLTAASEKEYHPLYGRYLFQRGKREAALAEFQRLAKEDPDDRDARSRLIAAYIAMNRVAEAEKILAAALKHNSKDTDALLQRSDLRLRKGDLENAGSDVLAVLKFKPDSAEAHYDLAIVEHMRGVPERERQELADALRLNAAYLPARLLLAQNYLMANDGKSAVAVLAETPPEQSDDMRVAIQRNWALLLAGNTAEAKRAIEAEFKVRPLPDLLLQDGIVKLNERDYQGAIADADAVLQQNPEDLRASRLLVDSYAARGELTNAVRAVQSLAEQRPQSAALELLLGQTLMMAGRSVEAREALETAAALTPKSPAPKLELARLDMAGNHLDTARQNVNAALALNSRDTAGLLLAAEIERRAGNQAAALARYRSALDIDPSNLFALNNAAYLEAAENPDEALKLGQRALELAPENAAVQDTVGWIYYRKGIYTAAVEHLKEAVAKEPTARRQFHLAVSYLKTGDRELGQKILAGALKQDPNLPKTEQGW